MQPFAHSEMLSALWIKPALYVRQLTDGNTINTYDADPGMAGSLDSWDGGVALYHKVLLIANVGILSAGTLTISFRDDDAALTAANGDANSSEVCSLTAISAIGMYIAEINLRHIFPYGSTRGVARDNDDGTDETQRYHSVRAVAAGGNATFGVTLVYGFNDRAYPSQDATSLTVTYNDS